MALWAVQRSKVDNASKNDVILLRSSRVLFDIQLNDWEQETGKRHKQASESSFRLKLLQIKKAKVNDSLAY